MTWGSCSFAAACDSRSNRDAVSTVVRVLTLDDLQGDRSADLVVVGLVDLAHPAFAEDAGDRVFAECRADTRSSAATVTSRRDYAARRGQVALNFLSPTALPGGQLGQVCGQPGGGLVEGASCRRRIDPDAGSAAIATATLPVGC